MNLVEQADKVWNRMDECLSDSNGINMLKRLVNNASTLAAMMETQNILSEGKKALVSLKNSNKKLSLSTHSRSVDNVLVYIFLKSISTIPSKTKAFRLGLIDKDGNLIKEPKTKEENDCISNLDLLMFRVRDWLKPRMQYLNSVAWIKGANPDMRMQNYFSNTEGVSRQYVVRRINDDLEKLLKKK